MRCPACGERLEGLLRTLEDAARHAEKLTAEEERVRALLRTRVAVPPLPRVEFPVKVRVGARVNPAGQRWLPRFLAALLSNRLPEGHRRVKEVWLVRGTVVLLLARRHPRAPGWDLWLDIRRGSDGQARMELDDLLLLATLPGRVWRAVAKRVEEEARYAEEARRALEELVAELRRAGLVQG